ncbi:MAG: hypothetical protein SPL13_03965 [Clostridia bacterium]|nr:hypothetical protein [Clostridia bacterium]
MILNNKFLKIFKSILITMLSVTLIFSAFMLLRSSKNASASTSIALSPVLPLTFAETETLNAPKETLYLEDGRIATIQGDDVVFYLPDGTIKSLTGFTSLKQLKNFGENLLVSNAGSLYQINLSDYTYSQLTYDNEGTIESVGGNYFDLNDRYLITAYGNNLTVYSYQIENGTSTISLIRSFGGVKGDCPIAINGDTVFYHNNGDPRMLYARPLTGTDITEIAEITVTDIIADDSYIYYIYGAKIYRRSLIDPTEEIRLEIGSSDKFDLGRLPSPVSLSFKGDNLFITDDVLNAAQEFKIEENKLYFTGYALASGKTAFNRVGVSASTDICGKTLVALDSKKLTLIKDVNGDLYSESNFTNLFLTELNGTIGFTPDTAIVGENTVMLLNKEVKTVTIIDFNGNLLYSHNGLDGNNLTSACYADGVYYVAKIGGGLATDTQVYKFDENNTVTPAEPIFTATENFGAGTLISADIYGNVYLTDSNGFIYNSNDFTSALNHTGISGIIKIVSDMAGNVFALTANGVSYVSGGVDYDIPIADGNLKSFALSYDQKTVYFTVNGSERVFMSDALPNLSADSVKIPTEFKTSSTSADISAFKSVSIEGATALSVSVGENVFNFGKIESGYADEYICVCEATSSGVDPINGNTLTLDLYVILGKNEKLKPQLYLVRKDLATDTTVSVKHTTATCEVYVTTDVNAYYIPMISDGNFLLTDGEGVLRISAKTKIIPLYEIAFNSDGLNEKFYYAKLENSEGEEVFGYIPENFTVDKLSEQQNGDTVVSQIKGEKSNSLRNSLIIIALSASVFGTSLFFILKKKNV